MKSNFIEDRFLPLWWIRLTRFEFWPYWVFYFPMLFYGLWLALKNGSLSYYTAVNPGMTAGGIVGEGKLNLLEQIHERYVPSTIIISADFDVEAIKIMITQKHIDLPFIIKPNSSERGIGVEVIDSFEALGTYLSAKKGEFLIQELIDSTIELGILYYRFPHGRSGITSIVQKEFLTITGDGLHTVSELIRSSTRARFRLYYLLNKFGSQLNTILSDGEKMVLEPIGNHNRGTTFLNANRLISKDLVRVIDEIAFPLKGFNYGRFDIKVKSLADLEAGQGIHILEVNGVESEPAHIYDPQMTIFKAYRDIIKHMSLISEIALANKKLGIHALPFKNFIFVVRQHLKQRSYYT